MKCLFSIMRYLLKDIDHSNRCKINCKLFFDVRRLSGYFSSTGRHYRTAPCGWVHSQRRSTGATCTRPCTGVARRARSVPSCRATCALTQVSCDNIQITRKRRINLCTSGSTRTALSSKAIFSRH